MIEHINRRDAIGEFERCNAENPRWTPQRVKALLLRMPAADVAPVVRCKDGIYLSQARPSASGSLVCAATGMDITPCDFCSWGERRLDHVED